MTETENLEVKIAVVATAAKRNRTGIAKRLGVEGTSRAVNHASQVQSAEPSSLSVFLELSQKTFKGRSKNRGKAQG